MKALKEERDMAYEENDERDLGFEEEPDLYGKDTYEGLGADTFGERIEGSGSEEEVMSEEDRADDDTPATGQSEDTMESPDRER